MSKFTNAPLLDQATLRRLDDDLRSGKYDGVQLPPAEPLDPKSDPFGMDYEWLEPSRQPTQFDLAFGEIATAHPDRRFARVSADLRGIALEGSLASGSDDEVIDAWTRENFVALCRAEGESGDELVARIKTETVPTRELIAEVYEFLSRQPDFAGWDAEKRIAAAMVVMDILKGSEPLPPTPAANV